MARRKRKNGGKIHFAVEVNERRHFTTLIATTSNVDCNSTTEVANCIRSSLEISKMTTLQGAVISGHINACQRLVKEGAFLKSCANGIPHPLCLALQNGHYEIATVLIKAGADVNLAFGKILPIAFALEGGKCTQELLQLVIDAGFPKNGVVNRSTESTILHVAIDKNLLNIAEYLLLKLSVDPNVRDSEGYTPLHYAVQTNNSAMVKLLAKSGAKLDSECNDHITPMFLAIASGSSRMVKLLISLGSDIHHITGSKECSMMPLHFSATVCQHKITKLLLENGADVNKKLPSTGEIALHTAARSEFREKHHFVNKKSLGFIVELLVNEGSDLKARSEYGLTPLQVAIQARNMSVVKILIMSGSEINNLINVDKENFLTTFHLAAKSFDKELVKVCLNYGADYMVKSEIENRYPIHYALLTSIVENFSNISNCDNSLNCSQFNKVSIFKLFWRNGFPYDLTLKTRWATGHESLPLPSAMSNQIHNQILYFTAMKSQSPKLMQKAISQGAEVRCSSTEITSPVHFMASKGNAKVLKLCLRRGAVVNCLDNWGETPLHTAARGGFLDCCQALLEYGAIYNYTSSKCPKTPLQVAHDKGYTEIVKLIKIVDKHFKSIRKDKFKRLKPDMKVFVAVMRCCNRNGMTLMGKAIKLGLKEKVERLMKLRLNFL